MKNTSLIRFLIAGFLLLANQTYAQYPTIDSLKLIPANPTDNDELKVVCYATFPYGSCQLNSVSYPLQQGNTLMITLDYTVGMAAYICHSIDTVPFENPGIGDFQLEVTLVDEDIMYDQFTIPFTVIRGSLGTPEFDANSLVIYPNPFENELKFKTNFTIEKLEVHSVSGQKVRLKESLSNNGTIDVSSLEQGIYLITLIDKNGNKFTQRVIKNTP